jgi:3-hydroxyisobutyrate dehydrogenase
MGQSHVMHLLADGFSVTVWNRDKTKCEPVARAGAAVADTPSDVVKSSEVTFVMLSNAAAALDVYQQPTGVLAGLEVGKGVVDCASLDAETMRQLDALVQGKGGKFCAAPVAGHSGMARDATCQFICAGNEELYITVDRALSCMSKHRVFVGADVGAASNHKVVLNGLLAKITASMGEALAQAEAADLEQATFMEIVEGHAMNSPLLQLCARMMISGEHTPLFMLQHMEKDARLADELARSTGQPSPVTAATLGAYAAAKQDGRWNELNWTAIHDATKAAR